MSIFQQTLLKISKINLISLAKYSVTSSSSTESFYFKSNFTQEEQTKILNIINDSNAEQLSRFNVSQFRIKNIESWKNKRGPFRSLGEVLEVEGLGEKLLHRLCEDIVSEKASDQLILNRSNGKTKRNKQLVTPVMTGNVLNNLTSGVGIHLSPIGISWAKINKEGNKLVSWNFEDFSSLPKKMLLDETFTQSINIVKKIPLSDVYIFETSSTLSPQSQSQSSAVSAYTQQLELNAMLLALINTSVSHNVTLQNLDGDSPQKSIENVVYYLKNRIPARLFSTLVGQEKVSAIATIKQLIENGTETSSSPCTPIAVEQQLKNTFYYETPAHKELLGQALMLIISFMDLCVYRNAIALSAVSASRNKKQS